jgi:hypothetical protein
MGWLGRLGSRSKGKGGFDFDALSCAEMVDRVRSIAAGEDIPGLDQKRPLNEQLESILLEARTSLEGRPRDGDWVSAMLALGEAWTALSCDEEALNAFCLSSEVLGSCPEGAHVHLRRALALGRLCRFEETVEAGDLALSLSAGSDPVLEARCNLARGGALLELHALKQAISACIAAREVFADQGLPLEAARCDMYQGIALARLGYPVKAIAVFETTSRSFRRHGEHVDAAVCILNRGAALGNLIRRKPDDVMGYVKARAQQVNERRCDPSLTLVWAMGCFVQARDTFMSFKKEDHIRSCEHLAATGLRNLVLYRPAVRSTERYSLAFVEQYHEHYHKLLEAGDEPMVASDHASSLADSFSAVRS